MFYQEDDEEPDADCKLPRWGEDEGEGEDCWLPRGEGDAEKKEKKKLMIKR